MSIWRRCSLAAAAITLIVPCVAAGYISLSPPSLQFVVEAVGETPPAQSVKLTNSGDSAYFTAIASPEWISVQPSSGRIAAGATGTLTVTVSPANLEIGTHYGSIEFRQDGSPAVIHVSFVVGGGGAGVRTGGGLTAYPPAVTFNARSEASWQLIWLDRDDYLAFTTKTTTLSGGNWLSVTADQGTGPAWLVIKVDPSGVPVGRHFGRIEVITALGTLIIPVTFNVATTGPGNIRVSTNSLDFPRQEGRAVAWTQSLTVTSPAGSTGFTVLLPKYTPWLSVSELSGQTPATLNVTVNPEGQVFGVHSGIITFLGSDGYSQQSLLIKMAVPPRYWSVAPESLAFTAAAGGAAPPQMLAVSLSEGGPGRFSAWTSTDSGGPWLNARPVSGTTPGTVQVTASAQRLGPGTYAGSILIETENGGIWIPVRFTVPPGASAAAVSEPPALEAAAGATSVPAGGSAAGSITVGPAALQFTAIAGGEVPPTQQVLMRTSSNAADFTTTASSSWLSVQPPSGTITPANPAFLTVYVNPINLPAGTHYGSIVVNGGGESVTLPVTVVLGAAGGEAGTGGGLTASPMSVTMSAPYQAATPVQQDIALSSAGTLAFTAFPTTVSENPWLSVTQTRGSAPTTLHIQAKAEGIARGSHSGTVVVNTALGTLLIPVTFNVGITGPGNIHASPAFLDFRGSEGDAEPSVRSLYVTSLTGHSMEFTATVSRGNPWVSLSQSVGRTPATLRVTVNPAGLPPGASDTVIGIRSLDGYSQRSVEVKVTLRSRAWTGTPDAFAFTAAAGGTAPAQKLTEWSFDLRPFFFTVWTSTTSGGSWLGVTPNSSVTPGPVSVTASASGLSPGTYGGRIRILQNAWGDTVPVTFTVTQVVNMAVAPESLAFEAVAGATSIPGKTLNVNVAAGNMQFTATAATSSGGSWLRVAPASGATPGAAAVTANPSGLSPGNYNGTVTVSVPGATNSPRTVPVTLTITSAAPAITAVLNAAAGTAGILSAGTIGSIYGRGLGPDTAAFPRIAEGGLAPGQVGEVRVLIDGIPAVILYAQSRQINFVIPWSLSGRATVSVEVEYKGVRSASVQIQSFDASPAIFSLDGSGLGQGAILNQDGSVNGRDNPAAVGAVAVLFGTGMGQTEPRGVDGVIPIQELPKPVLPVSVLIGNTEAEVLYAGAAPYLVSGAMQVNVKIPRDLQPGAYALTLRIGRFSSQRGITMVVK